ncbi:hypothetical protein FOZ62_012688, partial [Perkinsus olseni]
EWLAERRFHEPHGAEGTLRRKGERHAGDIGEMARRKSRSKLEPEQRELMALKREDILIPGKSDAGGYPKVWLGYDVFGEGLQKLTDRRPDFAYLTSELCSVMMPILRHLLYAVFVLVLGQPYLIEAASRAPEILTGDHEFMNHTEPRSPSGGPSKKRKVAQDIEPEQRELMVGNKCHNAMIHPLKRENILVTGAEAGRYPKVWLGYDVMGQAEGLHQLTDVRELHHKEGSPYSFFRMMVDKEVEEGSEW